MGRTTKRVRVEGDVRALWEAIINYADTIGEEAGQGNSGEFHSDEEARICAKERMKATKKLCVAFASVTGWLPVQIKATEKNEWVESWDVRPNSRISPK